MHPVEATLYYTAGCMPALFGFHPVLALGCIADCAFGAWLGHDGFQVNRVMLLIFFFSILHMAQKIPLFNFFERSGNLCYMALIRWKGMNAI